MIRSVRSKEALNKPQIGQIAHRNETSEAVFSMLAVRERNRGLTDLRRLKNQLIEEGFKIVPAEFIQAFRDLDKAGIGELNERSGQPAQFKWHYGLKDVGRAAMEGTPPLPPAPKPPAPVQVTKVAPESKKYSKSSVAVILGESRVASFEVPADITAAEVEILVSLLKKSPPPTA